MGSILVVEDEKTIADLIGITLEEIGLSCVKAYDGNQAAEWIET